MPKHIYKEPGKVRDYRVGIMPYSMTPQQPQVGIAPTMMAGGGYVPAYNHGGGVHPLAKGTDTVPAMLTEDEFVVDKDSADEFGGLLELINAWEPGDRGLKDIITEYKAGGGRIEGKMRKLYNEGYTNPKQAYAIAKSMGY